MYLWMKHKDTHKKWNDRYKIENKLQKYSK